MAIAIAFASVGSALEDSDFLFVPPVFDVTSFGALGDGETDDSQAFLSAWEAACFVPSSTVLFPATYSFVIGPVELSGPCADYITLRVDGTIMARDDLSNWNVDLDGWLVFSGLQLFRLTGYGVIDGRGDFWWAYSCKIYPFASVLLRRISAVEISYLTLKDSQEFHLSVESCNEVYMTGLQVVAPSDSPNTDGIHIVRSENVYLQDTLIGTGNRSKFSRC
ncbi:hypothetical protein SELMODRAFT_102892 [Selaginella moellendorffii]|uniref:Pectate lyase superfamily protein domain-containing protein n=1 Tax=Selaginella moellendorffii TaxID=88036 RepID=D8RVJ7_SELML|nr:hypothetical protein SELMODRAFT_102892 [Selaginella moellendorffii]